MGGFFFTSVKTLDWLSKYNFVSFPWHTPFLWDSEVSDVVIKSVTSSWQWSEIKLTAFAFQSFCSYGLYLFNFWLGHFFDSCILPILSQNLRKKTVIISSILLKVYYIHPQYYIKTSSPNLVFTIKLFQAN